MKKKLLPILLLALSSLALYKIGDNVLKLGDGQPTPDKEIVADIGAGASNPKLSYNTTSSAWEFSNDGATSQPMGSGSGGGSGINLVQNSGFELSTNNWTNAGSGTFATTTAAANVGYGDASGEWDAAAASDTLTSDIYDIPNVLGDVLCLGEMYYKGGDGNITMQVLDGATVLASKVLVAQTTFKPARISFLCPKDGTAKFQLLSAADAAIIYLDQVKIGTKGPSSSVVETKWEDFTPSFNGVASFTTVYAKKKRRGETMLIDLMIQGDGVSFGTTSLEFNVPDSKTISRPARDLTTVYGRGTWEDAGVRQPMDLTFLTATSFRLRPHDNPSGTTVATTNISTTFGATNDYIAFVAEIPIQEWEGLGVSNVINDDAIQSNEKFSAYGLSSGQSVPASTVTLINTWNNPYSNPYFDGTTYTIQTNGRYRLKAQLRFGSVASTSSQVQIFVNAGIVAAGVADQGAVEIAVATDIEVDLQAGDTVQVKAYHTGGTTLNNSDYAALFSVTRIHEISAGESFEFGIADNVNYGLIKAKIPSGDFYGIESGTYTPTAVAGTNVQGITTFPVAYLRIGGTVYVQIRVNVDHTGAGAATDFRLSVPIASNFASSADGSGSASCDTATADFDPIHIVADSINDNLQFLYNHGSDLGGATQYSLVGVAVYQVK